MTDLDVRVSQPIAQVPEGEAMRPTFAYVLKRYPRLSETFILQEMLALEAQGIRLHVYSLMNPEEAIVHRDVQRLIAPVTYLPDVALAGWRELLHAHLHLISHMPRRYLRTLGFALWRRTPLAGLRHFLRAGWLGRELEREQITHLHAHFAHGPAATAEMVAHLFDITFSFTGHAKDIYTTPRAIVARRIQNARYVITCTEFNRTFLASLVPDAVTARIHRIYHGVDRDRFTPTPPATSDAPPILLSIGRFVEKKGLTYLIAACAQLRDQGVSFRCQIIGGGPLRAALQAQITQAQLDDRVTLLAPCDQATLVEHYQAAAVVVLPCVVLDNGDRDGIPNVLVEAQSMARPVVSTAISGIPELIADGYNGLLVPPQDVPALAAALARLLADPDLRARMGTAGSAVVGERFDQMGNARRVGALLLTTVGTTQIIEG